MSFEVILDDGKYTFVNDNGIVRIKKNGEEWRDESGDEALLSLLHEFESLEVERDFWNQKFMEMMDRLYLVGQIR